MFYFIRKSIMIFYICIHKYDKKSANIQRNNKEWHFSIFVINQEVRFWFSVYNTGYTKIY